MAANRKLLFMIPTLHGGGAERVFTNLARAMDRSLFEIHLAVLQAAGPFMREVPADVHVHNLKISRVRYAMPGVLRLIWKLKPDTVFSTLGHLNLALAFAKPFMPKGTRLVVRPAWSATTPMEKVRHPQRWIWAYRWLYARADVVLCQSDYMVNDVRKHFGLLPEKLVRIYNPIDFERVWTSSQTGSNPYVSAGPNIVTAGRLSWEKGLDVLLQAMPAVMQAFPSARLYILGEGSRLEELLEQARQLGVFDSTHFLGFQENPWTYFRNADLFVLPSRNDALPNALLEALALGTPVVATDCPGSIREIQVCDETMVLVPPENPKALAKAIISACQSPRRTRDGFREARTRLSRFDLQDVAQQYSVIL